MTDIIKEAIQQGLDDCGFETPNAHTLPGHSFVLGWKEGYEWVLTELAINKKISEKDLKKYMKMLD